MASLIKTGNGKSPSRAIQFTNGEGDRKTIRLGKIGLANARVFKNQVELLVSCSITNTALSVELSTWLVGLPDSMHAKLATVGLVEPRTPEPTSPTLEIWTTKYIGQRRSELKPATIVELEFTASLLREKLGSGSPIDRVTPDEAHSWRAWLAEPYERAGRETPQKRSDATVRKHVRNAKSIFGAALDRELITRNPFKKLASSAVAAERGRYITPSETDDILEHCEDTQWKALFGLARLAGLRVPSETHRLTWADVDFEKLRLSVFSPKTERYERHKRRLVPMVPKLAKLIQDAFDDAHEGQKGVLRLSAIKSTLRTEFFATLKRAEVDAWPRPWQVLRQSCATEWKQTHPAYAVDAWMGHSQDVSEKHYLTIPDSLWNSVTESAAECAAEPSRTPSQRAANEGGEQDESRECQGESHEKTPTKIGVSRDEADEIRTRNVRIDSPVL